MNAVAGVGTFRFPVGNTGTQVEMEYDVETQSVWAFMNSRAKPCFSLSMIADVRRQDGLLERTQGMIETAGERRPVRYYVGGSRTPGVYSYGGDLALFVMLARAQDREALIAYARRCIDCLWARLSRFGHRELVTIALVQGDALGGGFESVLASDVIVAEEDARFGFPEILFNLFPGMGAYSLLARRIGNVAAERMILGGDTYSARQLEEIGVVDVVAPSGQGEAAVRRWMLKNERRINGMRGVFAARNVVHPVTRGELDSIAVDWADAALRLGEAEFRVMTRFARVQERRAAGRAAVGEGQPRAVEHEVG